MCDKRRRPEIRKLITPGLQARFLEGNMSPKGPLEFQVLSPRGVINRDICGIGLGIVAALEHTPTKKSNPIPVSQSRKVDDQEIRSEVCSFEEEYTIVTRNKPNKRGCIFSISPTRFGDYDTKICQSSSFLSSCHLCNKRLHGKDIYIYRGEKAFCSPECRSRQIAMDERPEKYCSSQASSNGTRTMMSPGIFAT